MSTVVWLSICEEVIGLSIDRDYFKDRTEWDGSYPYPPEFKHMEDLSGLEAAPGVLLKPFWGQSLLASYVTFAPNSVAPLHQHEQEQLSLVLQGRLFFTVGDRSQWMEVGDVVSIPGGVPHAAEAGPEGAVAVDMFSPPREGFKRDPEAK